MHVPATLITKCYQLSIDSLSTSSHCTCLALESDQFYSKNTCCNWENKLSSIQNDIAELKTSKIGNFQFSCSSRSIHLASLTSKSVDFLTHSATILKEYFSFINGFISESSGLTSHLESGLVGRPIILNMLPTCKNQK